MNEELLGDGGRVGLPLMDLAASLVPGLRTALRALLAPITRVASIFQAHLPSPSIDLVLANPVHLSRHLAQEHHVEDAVGERASGGLLKDKLGRATPDLVLADLES